MREKKKKQLVVTGRGGDLFNDYYTLARVSIFASLGMTFDMPKYLRKIYIIYTLYIHYIYIIYTLYIYIYIIYTYIYIYIYIQ